MREQDARTIALIGEKALLKLKGSRVAVFGIGGVGSYAVEALARSGVGTLYLYDNDTVSKSNINRQLIALNSTIDKEKVTVAAERIRDINPDISVFENKVFVTPETTIPFADFDYIIDAVDNVTAKLFLCEGAVAHNVPIISVMGTGNKLDPSRLQISDISKTHTCPLARVMRLELKKRSIKKLTAVWSDEVPQRAQSPCGEHPAPASMTFVPGSAGLMAASYVIRELIK